MPIGVLAVIGSLFVHATPAQAAQETWVSSTGTNTGNCPATAPCKTFQYAHNKTTAGGTLNVLSSGSFGDVTITKSISIVADGAQALIRTVAACGAGICINAGANGVVNLRGLTIEGTGSTSTNGILLTSAKMLRVHKSFIRKTGFAINFSPSSASELYVTDTTLADNTGSGITVDALAGPPGPTTAKVSLDRVNMEDNEIGLVIMLSTSAANVVNATLRDSVVAGNRNIGIFAGHANGNGSVQLMIDRSAVLGSTNSGIVAAGANAKVFVGDSTFSGNAFAMSPAGGTINTYGTNKVHGNGGDGSSNGTVTYQ
jgi:hypothetical protein